MKKLNQWLNSIQYFLLPAKCLLCANQGINQVDLCSDCSQTIKPIDYACRCCAEPYDSNINSLCGHCLQKKPYFDKVFAVTLYQNNAKKLVLQLKHQQNLASSKVIAQLLNTYWQQLEQPEIDAVTYVPSHQLRKRDRGFNQSYLIAKHFCSMSGLQLAKSLLKRTKWSNNQVGLSRKKRINNIKNSFLVNSKNTAKRILLIDDVVTTASTVNEVARVLKKAGAEQVFVLAFARTAK